MTHFSHEARTAAAAELARRFDHWVDTQPAAQIPLRPADDDSMTCLHQQHGGAKVDTSHPGPIVMIERPSAFKRFIRRHVATLAGALFALALISASMFLTPDVTEQLMRLAR